jgi:hypothetical protein
MSNKANADPDTAEADQVELVYIDQSWPVPPAEALGTLSYRTELYLEGCTSGNLCSSLPTLPK